MLMWISWGENGPEDTVKTRNYKPRKCIRQKLWTSIRILSPKPFTIPALCCTVEEATVANVQSYVSRLFNAGILAKFGQVKRGHCGDYQQYKLVKDLGPTMPVLNIGRHKKKEKEKETNSEVTV